MAWRAGYKQTCSAATYIAREPAAATPVPALTAAALPAAAGLPAAAPAAQGSSEHWDRPALADFGFDTFMHRKA